MLIKKKIYRATLERHQGGQEAEEKMWEDLGLYWVFWGKGKAGKGLGLASLSNFGCLWVTGLVPSCLAPGPGMIKAEEYCLPGCRGRTEEGPPWMTLPAGPFAIS